ncbi:cation:dicarboxylase symporter family transporter [Carnobacterium sp. PL12RED10]|uniref:dicarboxylate/amino acid:cation symporter n=1 Tax=Carnobacterium sp. PL12RED10 TaxID=2592351 RepID=UPI0011EC9928|nr:dicarboxylate/amino acid:cation symporter [Carnobacterium sp. PL12RED10]KAF3299167.1 cation:dicarboxylase symporter family transporter [Carnobacterium sp. PL12RED10]
MAKKGFKIPLALKLVIAIILGIIVGQFGFLPEIFFQVLKTLSGLFSEFLTFIIPLMIVGLIIPGIAELAEGAGKLLGITVAISYGSTIVAGILAYTVASNLFPMFITSDLANIIQESGEGATALFSIGLEPMFSVTAAIIFAFMLGLGISWLRARGRGEALMTVFTDFGKVIDLTLQTVVIPFLPFYIFFNFADMSYSGSVFAVMSVFWRVLVTAIVLHLLYLSFMFAVVGAHAGKNPIKMMKNQIPGWLTAAGTQSSAATIPTNVEIARKNGVSEQIANFVVPLCATIHLAGSMITIISCVTAILMMYSMPISIGTMAAFVMVLGIAMVAAPGAPGGAIVSALPFLPMVGLTEAFNQLAISLYITQDSFGTATNVSGDNAIAVIVDAIYKKDKKAEQAK